MFFSVVVEMFSSGIFATNGSPIQEHAHMSILKMEKPNASESADRNEPVRKNVSAIETAAENMRQSGTDLRQNESVMSAE